MDLRERKDSTVRRHPWELSRCKAVRSILEMIPAPEEKWRLLDVGCGDGFISYEMAIDHRIGSITGIDIHLSEEQAAGMGSTGDRVAFHNKYDDLKRNHYNLALLLDVIEHVEHDGAYLRDIVRKYVSPGGFVVITAPAHRFLFGSHDRFLKLYRRYSRKELLGLIHSANLSCLGSGYLFFSLLPARFLSITREKLFLSKADDNRGIGAWSRGRTVTKAVELLLHADVRLGIALARTGVALPGLTVWALCKKPR